VHDTDPPRPANYKPVHRAGGPRREPTERAEVKAYQWLIAIHAANANRDYAAARDYRQQALDVMVRGGWDERQANYELDRMSPQAAHDADELGRLDNATTTADVLALIDGSQR
jgi:hypothetical protein